MTNKTSYLLGALTLAILAACAMPTDRLAYLLTYDQLLTVTATPTPVGPGRGRCNTNGNGCVIEVTVSGSGTACKPAPSFDKVEIAHKNEVVIWRIVNTDSKWPATGGTAFKKPGHPFINSERLNDRNWKWQASDANYVKGQQYDYDIVVEKTEATGTVVVCKLDPGLITDW